MSWPAVDRPAPHTDGRRCAGPRWPALALVGLLAWACAPGEPERQAEQDSRARPATRPGALWITGARVIDGSGAAPFEGAVRIEAGRIAEVGTATPEPGASTLDARGKVLAPGFIDTHSHADADLEEDPSALALVSQGVTTAVVGQDGESPYPLADFFARLGRDGVAVNVASFAGHGTLRAKVLGEEFRRPARPNEIEQMSGLLRGELEGGALGLSTGLEYDPGIYAATDEVVALARVAAAAAGRYASHIRSEDRRFWEALDELIAIGREAELPVHVSHIKLALRRLHGQADRLLEVLDDARASGVEISADLYPYTFWQSTLTVMFPERDFEDREAATFAVTELSTPAEMLIARFQPDPELVGKTLAEIAERRSVDPATALIQLIGEAETLRQRSTADGGEVESVIAVSMTEADVERLMRWPFINFCTDGELAGTHPRGFGSFPRVLGRYVRERRVLSLEAAVHRMTGLAADSMGLRDRGLIQAGMYADLVLFDPQTVIDRATTEEPHALSTGIDRVWVSGELVFEDGRVTGQRPGRAIRRPAASRARP